MSKKLTIAQWRERRIFNSHEIAKRGGGRFYITHHAHGVGSIGGIYVMGVTITPDPSNERWGEGGRKWFHIPHKGLAATIEQAKRWCIDQGYAPEGAEWERDPWQGWHLAGTMAAAASSTLDKGGTQ